MNIKTASRRHMTLLEVMIAMGLAVMVLTTLTYFYSDIDSLNREMERIQKESFHNLYVENRLSMILPRAVSERDSKKDFYFFTSTTPGGFFKAGSTNLVFTFDNGVMLDKDFSNHVLARLYLDPQNRLCLATWPSPKRWNPVGLTSMKKEVLLENVEQLQFSFYVPPEKDRSKWGVASKPLEIKGPWVNEWRSEYKQLPTLIKVELVKKVGKEEKPMTFAFSLPNAEKFIIYSR